jgi:hypothetical protein
VVSILASFGRVLLALSFSKARAKGQAASPFAKNRNNFKEIKKYRLSGKSRSFLQFEIVQFFYCTAINK